MKLFIKTNNKETRKLPMTGKVRKGFCSYCFGYRSMYYGNSFC